MLDFIIKYWLEFFLGILSSGMVALAKTMRSQHEKNRLIGNAVEALLRDRIVQAHHYYAEVKGYCEVDDRRNIELMYSAYHALGGNDIATNLYQRILALPTTNPKENEEKEEK